MMCQFGKVLCQSCASKMCLVISFREMRFLDNYIVWSAHLIEKIRDIMYTEQMKG